MTLTATVLQDRLHHRLHETGVAGAALSCIRDDDILLACGGVRDRNDGTPVDAGTVFDVASLTKPLVSYAVLQLADAGVLDLDAPLAATPRWSPAMRAAAITARHVLSHTAACPTACAAASRCAPISPRASASSYSSVGFGYLQSALEAVTGEPLEAWRRTVFAPLGMASSSTEWQPRFAATSSIRTSTTSAPPSTTRRACPRTRCTPRRTTMRASCERCCVVSACARPYTGNGWSRSCRRRATAMLSLETEAAPTAGSGIGWGLGWGIETARGAFFQWGKMPGVRAFVMGSPAERRAVVLLSNSNRGLRLMHDAAQWILPASMRRCAG